MMKAGLSVRLTDHSAVAAEKRKELNAWRA